MSDIGVIYLFGVFFSLIVSCFFLAISLMQALYPNRSMLLKNLSKLDLIWTPHKGLQHVKNFRPAEASRRFIFSILGTALINSALSWLGIILSINAIYKIYSRYRKSYKIMMAFLKLNTEKIENDIDLFGAVVSAFLHELSEGSPMHRHLRELSSASMQETKEKINEVINKSASKTDVFIDINKQPGTEKELRETMPTNKSWQITVDYLCKLSPLNMWETQMLSHYLEFGVHKNIWILSGCVVRIILTRTAELNLDMDIIESPLSERETAALVRIIGAGSGELNSIYRGFLEGMKPDSNEAVAALLLVFMHEANPNFSLPSAKSFYKKASGD